MFRLVLGYDRVIKNNFSNIYSLSQVTNKTLKNTIRITFDKDPFDNLESTGIFYILPLF